MYALASTTCSIRRGTTTDAWGDVVDDVAAPLIATGVPVQIIVSNARPYDPTSQTIRIIQTITGAIQSDTDLRESDQLIDESTGAVYMIESVTQEGGPGFISDLELALRRVV